MKFSALLAIIAGLTLSMGMPVQAQQKKSAKTVKVSKKKAKKASSKKGKKAAKKKVTIKSYPFVAPVLLNPYSAKMPISAERKAKAIAELERRQIKPEAYVSKLMEKINKYNRDYDVAGLLVSAGVDVSSLQIDNMISLDTTHSVEVVKMLVQSPSFDVNRTEEGKSMLKKAIENSSIIENSSMEMLQVLLAQPGVKVDDETLLPAAIAAGWKEGANLLLSLPDVNVSKVPPVMLAVMKNDIKTLKKILEEGGADANVEVENSTPLMWAAQCGYNACLKLLLDTPGIDVNKEVNEKTPLMMAAKHAQTGATRLLLSADGIDVNHQRHVDMINRCNPKCVEIWLDASGFNLPIDTLIHELIRKESPKWVNMDLVKKLVKRPGSKVSRDTVKHVYDYYQADYYLAREIMQVLMEAEHVETDGISPLMLACILGDEEKIKKLLADQTVEVDNGLVEKVLFTGQIPIIKLLLESPKCKLTSWHVGYITQMGNQELISLLLEKMPQAVNEFFMLHSAAKSGKVDSLNAILAVPGVDVNKLANNQSDRNDDNTSALMLAAESGYDDCVAALLKVEGINATYEKPGHGNAFTYAVERGHAECAKLLMAIPGFDVNHRHVLADAAERGNIECVELLLNAPGINVNAGNPLAKALQNEHWEIVKLLMAHPDVNKDACPPLMMSLVSGDVQELQKQLDSQKEEINKKGINNRTPLEWAVHLKQLEAAKILLATPGCEYDATQLLQTAIQNRDVEMMKLIMAQPDVKIEPVNIYSQRLVDLAMASGSSEVLKLVMTIPGVDAAGLSPLQHAIAMDDAAKMKELMKSRKQSVNQSDTGEEWKPLAYAAYMGSEECVKALLTVRGIKVNELGYSTGLHYHSLSTALYCSAFGGHANVMKLLLGMKGIDVNAGAPLTAAAHCSSVECVKLLLAAPGIDVNKCGYQGGPALDYAKNPEIRKMLMEAGAR